MARRSRMGSKRTKTIAFDMNKMTQEIRAIILQEGMAIIGDMAELIAQEANNNAPKLQPEVMPSNYTGDHIRGPNKRNGDQESGPIKGSVFAMPSPRIPASWLVVSPSWYSHFMEYGTQPHEMPNAEKQNEGVNMVFPGTNTWSGKIVSSKWNFHPGFRGHPFLRPAGDMAEQFLLQVLNKRYGV